MRRKHLSEMLILGRSKKVLGPFLSYETRFHLSAFLVYRADYFTFIFTFLLSTALFPYILEMSSPHTFLLTQSSLFPSSRENLEISKEEATVCLSLFLIPNQFFPFNLSRIKTSGYKFQLLIYEFQPINLLVNLFISAIIYQLSRFLQQSSHVLKFEFSLFDRMYLSICLSEFTKNTSLLMYVRP